MNGLGIQAAAGVIATALFVTSTLPMLLKAGRTRDLQSYSLANITLANLANLLQWLYVSSLPIGPIWFLHGFNSGSTLLMLVWYLRYTVTCKAVPCLARKLLAELPWPLTRRESHGQPKRKSDRSSRRSGGIVREGKLGVSPLEALGACC